MYIGNKSVKECFIGSTPVRAIYVGARKVWELDSGDTATLTLNVIGNNHWRGSMFVYVNNEEIAYKFLGGVHTFSIAKGSHVEICTEDDTTVYPVTISKSDFIITQNTTVDIIMPSRLVIELGVEQGVDSNICYELHDENGELYTDDNGNTEFYDPGTYIYYIPPGKRVDVVYYNDTGYEPIFDEDGESFVMGDDRTVEIITTYVPDYRHAKYQIVIDNYDTLSDAEKNSIEYTVVFGLVHGDEIPKEVTVLDHGRVATGILCECGSSEGECTNYDTNIDPFYLEYVTVSGAELVLNEYDEQYDYAFDGLTMTDIYTIHITV